MKGFKAFWEYLRAPDGYPPSSRSNEVVPGVDKPVIILAKMIALTLLEELPESQRYVAVANVYLLKTSKFWIKISVIKYRGGKEEAELHSHSFAGVVFDTPAQKIITNAFIDMKRLRTNLEKVKAEQDAENMALDAIAKWCKGEE